HTCMHSFPTRRSSDLGKGFGAMALASMLEAGPVSPLAPKAPPAKAHAKAVIQLFMHGGVSHVDTFDPKPELVKHDGKTISPEMRSEEHTSELQSLAYL